MPDGREVQVSAGLCGSCFYLNVLLRRARPSKTGPLYRLALHGKTSGVQGGREMQFLTVSRGAEKHNLRLSTALHFTERSPGPLRAPLSILRGPFGFA